MVRVQHEDCVSPVVGVLLLVVVTIVLILLILALFSLPHLCNPFPPRQFEIVTIHDYDEDRPILNYDSRVLLRYTGSEPIPNRPLSGRFFVDGVPIRSVVTTFHGQDFIPTHHFGIERMGGLGCQGERWVPGAFVLIDFKDGTFRPRQRVRTEIIDSGTGCIISRDEYFAPGPVR
ncbi:MAG TPA: hypothetical protein PK089_03475 [Methanoregulaceae archaeon]|nr:hypothetical protein [Methanoregulaceae archaeon]HQJ87270.1 hypothetical protein [Methanoregulaceae archaeon]